MQSIKVKVNFSFVWFWYLLCLIEHEHYLTFINKHFYLFEKEKKKIWNEISSTENIMFCCWVWRSESKFIEVLALSVKAVFVLCYGVTIGFFQLCTIKKEKTNQKRWCCMGHCWPSFISHLEAFSVGLYRGA